MEKELLKKLEFLAKGEEDTIDDYKDFINWLKENNKEHLIPSLKKIIDEESAHFAFLQKAMEEPNTAEYIDSDEEAKKAGKLFGMNFEKGDKK